MRLHLISLPHTETTDAYTACAYTSKATRFASMMTDHGHHLTLYAGEHNQARCAEHVPCISRDEQTEHRPEPIQAVTWDPAHPLWQLWNERVIAALRERVEPRDLILLATGHPLAAVRAAFPDHLVVEYGIGYEGVLDDTYRVWESHAWMHAVEARRQGSAMGADGRFFDTVIPNFFDPADFPEAAPDTDDPFVLFMSRWTERKGPSIAIEAARRAGLRLVVAGDVRPEDQAACPDHVSFVGHADPHLRGELMRQATAVLVPTVYLEPFGGVAAEALMCGTPAITTDWGAFPEYVPAALRCHTIREFTDAIHLAQHSTPADRLNLRDQAHARHALDAVAPQYTRCFDRLSLLWADGFYT